MMFATHSHSSPIRRAIRGCIVSAALFGAGAAMAQQAPSGLEKAIAAAGKWVAQADANQADAMWKASSPTMQKNVNQADWNKYIADVRQQAGAQQSRNWVGVSKVDNPQGMPAGQYLNVIYSTRFAKAATVETVSMAQNGSSWQPVGYIVRPAQPPQAQGGAPGASAPAAAK
ncbi:DUF4019 domain-containing protein [Dyella mobilis]|uniref:DUF4019 domain-containing protein n=1 Tax=Dyella mobilis TaxID=1849582 RepID=A0ABS2KD66_9GAMM|nr:DUF4019 domain-containing protein [Dyella mobilis]MBM7129121.1 DUF4019 domain-containing protein [Dyella mobilis]GLQ98415.1 hypothetical protein GCM10007863_28350 [Dyella mobilis]